VVGCLGTVGPNSDVFKLRITLPAGYFFCSSDELSCSMQDNEGRNVIPRRILIRQQGSCHVSRRRTQNIKKINILSSFAYFKLKSKNSLLHSVCCCIYWILCQF